MVFWDVMPCSFMGSDRCFKEACCLCLPGRRCRQQTFPKHRHLSIKLHRITLQETALLIQTQRYLLWQLTGSVKGRYWTVYSIFSIGTHYGLDSLGLEPWWGEVFCAHPDWPTGSPSLLYNGYWAFPRVKTAGAWCWPPTPSCTNVKGRVTQYGCSPFMPSWHATWWT
jgi:hypothetical protein